MILDGVCYSVIHFGRVILSRMVELSCSQSSKVFSDIFWSSLDVCCASPEMLCYYL